MVASTPRHGSGPGDRPPDQDDFILADNRPENPCRPLDWRSRIAAYLAGSGSRVRLGWIDEPARRLARHLRESASTGRMGRDRALSAAFALRLDPDPARREEVEALALSGLTDAEIAARQGLDVGVVAAYVESFFDVRPLLPHTHALLARAIGPALVDGKGLARELSLKALCIAGGPLVADALVGRAGVPAPATGPSGDAAELFEQYALLGSIRAGGRPGIALIRLDRLAADVGLAMSGLTARSVTGPVAMPGLELDAAIEWVAGRHPDGPDAARSGGLVRAGCAPEAAGPAPGRPYRADEAVDGRGDGRLREAG